MDEKPDFKAIHSQALEIVETNPILAYAVANAMRKRIVGRTPDTAKFELLNNLAYSVWNQYLEINRKDDPRNTVRILNLISDALILGHDILTERYTPHATHDGSPRR